jgi:hypothetical protein
MDPIVEKGPWDKPMAFFFARRISRRWCLNDLMKLKRRLNRLELAPEVDQSFISRT